MTTTQKKDTARLSYTKGGIPVLAVRKMLSRKKCLLTIYILEKLMVHPGVGQAGWRLNKIDQDGRVCEKYDVLLTEGYRSCECKDYLARHRECKHSKALRAVGLLPPLPQRSQA